MKTTIFTLVTICTLALIGCSGKGNGKNGYDISELYNSKNEYVLNGPRKAGLLLLCKGKELYYGTEKRMKVYSDGKHLHPHKIDASSSMYNNKPEMETMRYNKMEMEINLALDGLSYANISKPIEEDDWFYMEYHESEDRFYFYYVDLDMINIKND